MSFTDHERHGGGDFRRPAGAAVGGVEGAVSSKAAGGSGSAGGTGLRSAGGVGLLNRGNTCFMASAVQALAHIEVFAQVLAHSPAPPSAEVTRALQQLLDRMSRASALAAPAAGSQGYLSPADFVAAVRRNNALFAGLGQQDASEFLRYLLSQLEEDLAVPCGSTRDDGTRAKACLAARLFEGEMTSVVVCDACGSRSEKKEVFHDLNLQLSNGLAQAAHDSWGSAIKSYLRYPYDIVQPLLQAPLSLESCLADYVSAEALNGDNQYYCERCRCNRDAVRHTQLERLPEILCITLKRFKYSASRGASIKIGREVDFPLSGFRPQKYAQMDSGGLRRERIHDESEYNLMAVVTHSGSSEAGHYVTYCRSSDDEWFLYDDAEVIPVNAEEVAQTQAYLLFYQRASAAAEERGREIASLYRSVLRRYPNHPRVRISRAWLSMFNYATDPGPIFNWNFACEHGGVLPQWANDLDSVTVELPLEVFLTLQEIFGGGPLVLEAVPCRPCSRRATELAQRRHREKLFVTRYTERAVAVEEPADFCLHKQWATQWRNFVDSDDPNVGPPGPINNQPLLNRDGTPRQEVEEGVNYILLPRSLWTYFMEIYGGGPLVRLAD